MAYNTNGFAIMFYTIFSIVNCGVYIVMSQLTAFNEKNTIMMILQYFSMIFIGLTISILISITIGNLFYGDCSCLELLTWECNVLMLAISVIYNHMISSFNLYELWHHPIQHIIASNAVLCFTNIVLYISCCVIEYCILVVFFNAKKADTISEPPRYDDVIYHV